MQSQRPVYWYSGQFLEPQHFQQADAFHTSGKTALLESTLPCFWGVRRMNVDEAALAEGKIVIQTGMLRFQDGTETVIADILENGNALLPSRYFRDAWKDMNAPFTVFAGLPPLKPSDNVAGIPVCERNNGKLIAYDADTLPKAAGRYLCPNTDDSIADRYALPLSTESLGNAPVRTLYLYPRLCWESELVSHPDWLFLPVLRLTDNGSGPCSDPDYAPPCLNVTSSPVLSNLVRSLESRLAATVCRLDPPQRLALNAPLTPQDMLRGAAARTLSEVRHALAWPETHPRHLFGVFRHGFAELAACVGIPVAKTLPIYYHDNPAECFRNLEEWFRNIMRDLFPETAAVIPFRVHGEFLRADLPDSVGRARPLIVLQTDESPATVLNEGRLVVDAPLALPITLTQAVAGVPLREVSTPPGLLPRDGVRYLEIDVHSERWKAVVNTGSVGVAFFPLRGTAHPEHLRLLYLRG